MEVVEVEAPVRKEGEEKQALYIIERSSYIWK